MADNNYNSLEKMFHWLTLSSNLTTDMAFQLEKSLFAKHTPEDSGQHIFIAGLARAGTTVLMRLLYETGDFCSLTYKDMPLVMSPNLWQKMSGGSSKNNQNQQRAHGDGLMVNVNSPEALEEVFWRTYCSDDYLSDDSLTAMIADHEVIADFKTYVSLLLLRYNSPRYLSKNNNNILRLGTICTAFPQALVLVPFRQPLAQAQSLLQQHLHFSQRQQQQPFVANYMNWLAHFEFGLHHKPFYQKPTVNGEPIQPITAINYWLALWLHTYQWLWSQHQQQQQIQFVCYETLCESPQQFWQQLASRAAVTNILPESLAVKPPSVKGSVKVDANLLAKAEALYKQMQTGVNYV